MIQPCPFCGSLDVSPHRFMQVAATNNVYVGCWQCGAHGPVVKGEVAALEAWNRRAIANPAPVQNP